MEKNGQEENSYRLLYPFQAISLQKFLDPGLVPPSGISLLLSLNLFLSFLVPYPLSLLFLHTYTWKINAECFPFKLCGGGNPFSFAACQAPRLRFIYIELKHVLVL